MPVESVELRVELPDLSGWGLWIMVQFANTTSGLRAVIRRVSGRGIIVIASQRITGSFFVPVHVSHSDIPDILH